MARESAPPKRPALRWHGGKWRLAPWILGHFPKHRVYVEPFGGGASVLLRKPRSHGEIYNDLDECVVNLFSVIRDPASAARLVELLRLTPFARREFERAYEVSDDPVEEARRLLVRSYMGFGSDAPNRNLRTGFRSNSNRSNTLPAHDWANYPDSLRAISERFRAVVVECRDGTEIMAQHDSPATLHYVDPPYMPATRSPKARRGKERYHAYAHEMTVEDHVRLLDALRGLDGMVILSGYPSATYDAALAGWARREKVALADGAQPRIECLWLNPACVEALGHGPLFAEVAG